MGTVVRSVVLTALVTLLLGTAGCSSQDSAGTAAPSSAAESSTTYRTRHFAVPFTVTVDPAVLGTSPAVDVEHLVYFDAVDGERKMRFLSPATTYPPGSSTPIAPPADFLAYLRDQAGNGITLTDETTTTVGGRPATLVGAASDGSRPEGFYDGSLGCISPDEPQDSDDGCFGIQPDLPLRLAVIDVDGTTLLAWARPDEDAGTSEEEFRQHFETLLSTLEFD
jgi:hypothetical protein